MTGFCFNGESIVVHEFNWRVTQKAQTVLQLLVVNGESLVEIALLFTSWTGEDE